MHCLPCHCGLQPRHLPEITRSQHTRARCPALTDHRNMKEPCWEQTPLSNLSLKSHPVVDTQVLICSSPPRGAWSLTHVSKRDLNGHEPQNKNPGASTLTLGYLVKVLPDRNTQNSHYSLLRNISFSCSTWLIFTIPSFCSSEFCCLFRVSQTHGGWKGPEFVLGF